MKKQIRLWMLIVVTVLLSTLTFSNLSFATSSPVEESSYIIYRDGGLTVAKNGQTGEIEFSDTAGADVVIQAAIDALGANGGKISIKRGTYIINSSIDLKYPVTIEGEEWGYGIGTYLALGGDANYPMFKNTASVDGITLRNLSLNGKRNYGATSDLIYLYQTGRVCFENIEAFNAGRDTLSLEACESGTSIDCVWLDGGRYSVNITSGGNHLFLGGAIAQAEQYNLVLSTTNYNLFKHVEIHDAGYSGVYAVTDKHNTFFDCHFLTSYHHGIQLDRSTDDKILYCDFEDNSVIGLQCEGINSVGATGCWIVGNRGWDTRTPKKQVRLLGTDSDSSNFIIESNNCLDNYTTMNILGTGHIIKHNRGYVTENDGIATILRSTYVNVSHGLNRTPDANDIQVTPTSSLGGKISFWISNVGASTFRINVSNSTTASFAWKAVID